MLRWLELRILLRLEGRLVCILYRRSLDWESHLLLNTAIRLDHNRRGHLQRLVCKHWPDSLRLHHCSLLRRHEGGLLDEPARLRLLQLHWCHGHHHTTLTIQQLCRVLANAARGLELADGRRLNVLWQV